MTPLAYLLLSLILALLLWFRWATRDRRDVGVLEWRPNRARHFGASVSYGWLTYYNSEGRKETVAFTAEELTRLRARAAKNPEDRYGLPIGEQYRAERRKTLSALLLLAALLPAAAATEHEPYFSQVADAIYHAEGGPATRYPYGIKSVRVSGPAEARQVCLNTIRNNHRRWTATDRRVEFIDFLGDVYCPAAADAPGNARWKRNVRWFLKQQTR